MSALETVTPVTAARWATPSPRIVAAAPATQIAAANNRDSVYGPLLVLGIAAGEIAWLSAIGYALIHVFA